MNQSSYCFQLKAFDTPLRKKAQATSNICVKVLQTVNTETPQTNDEPTNDSISITTNKPADDFEPSNEFLEKLYPDNVFLLQSASHFSRVAQPLLDTNETGFKLTMNPFGAFNITPKSGIIYVVRSNLLAQALPTSSNKLEVTWKENQKQQINVILQPDSAQCGNNLSKSIEDFCARHDNQESCESSCGVGSSNGHCKWRKHEGFELMSKIFSTCVPDLKFCSNQICDPLEEIGSSMGLNICPQDCTKKVIGSVSTKTMGISGTSKGSVCSCDEFEDCFCGPANVTEMESTSSATTIKVSSTPFPHILVLPNQYECGLQCKVTLIAITMTALFLMLIIVIYVFCYARYRRLKIESKLLMPEKQFIRTLTTSSVTSAKFEEINETRSHPDFYSERWEVDIAKVKVGRMIGEGEFGKVMLATVQGNQGNDFMRVVIKMVKNVENESEMSSLKKEFEQLQKVSVHPHTNVINLLGCCSKGTSPWIFLEFCVFESLKDYLLASRLIPSRTDSDGVDKVSVDDILRFSLQIANGMAHLSLLKLVHRDLAARNVLLSEGKICKISDFGLTRNVCKSCDTYSKCSDDKVPVKWLAPESLSTNEEYTMKSDVWAFGILGYELIMLGSSPYPNIATNHFEILNLLVNGYRMKCPENCKIELFSIFESCWAYDPTKRLTFDELAVKFDQLIRFSTIKNLQEPLWTTPEFSSAEQFDATYYKDYIIRVEEARSFLKTAPSRKRKTSNQGTESTKKLISGNSIDNVGYDSNFNAMKSLLVRQQQQKNDSTGTISEVTSGSCSSFASSTFAPRYLPMVKSGGSTSVSTAEIVGNSVRGSDSGYISMDVIINKTSSFP